MIQSLVQLVVHRLITPLANSEEDVDKACGGFFRKGIRRWTSGLGCIHRLYSH